MNFDQAREIVFQLLREKGKAKNSEMLQALGGDATMLEQVREDLLFNELAEDRRGAGLSYTGLPAGTTTPRDTPTPQAATGTREVKTASATRVTEGQVIPPADQQLPETEVGASAVPPSLGQPKLFLSYGRHDAMELADRLTADLTARGYEVWRDTQEIRPGTSWQDEIADGLHSAQLVIALMTPHSVRTTGSPDNPDNVDSVCLAEITHALFAPPPRPVLPVMVKTCKPPLAIFHLDYVDMRAWTDSSDRYRSGLKRLLVGIQAALRGEKRYRSWYQQLNPWDFAAFLYPKRRGFCGRQWLFKRIDDWRKASGKEPALLIKGDPGTGKSAIVAELVHRNPDNQVLAYHCCQWDVGETLEPWRFVRSVAAMIASELEDYAAMMQDTAVQQALDEAHCRSKPESALEEGVLAPLQRLREPEGGRRYLLIDALDESLLIPSGTLSIVDLLASRLSRLPPWLKIVATTRKEAPVLGRLAGLRAEELDAQSPENMADVRQYLAGRLENAGLAKRLLESRLTATEVSNVLCEKSAGNFLYVQQAVDGIERGLHEFGQLGTLPPGLAGLYVLRFNKQFPDAEQFGGARKVLDVIVAAREPLTMCQIAAATGLDPEEELPAVLKRLSAYVPARGGPDGVPKYTAYHKSLVDWLTEPSRRDELHSASPKRGHRCLADVCWQEYQRGPGSMSSYALAHLPAHLTAAQRWDAVETLFTDLSYLEAKTAAGRVFELAGDFTAAVAALPTDRPHRCVLGLLDEALRRDIHFIARHSPNFPQCLFQCLWNTCWWYDCPDAANHYEPSKAMPAERGPKDHQALKLHQLLEIWLHRKQSSSPGFRWLRSLRPPTLHLGTAQRTVLQGHRGPVKSLTYALDGRYIVSGAEDCTVRVWESGTGQELRCIRKHGDRVTGLSVSPDGRRIASASDDNTVRIWDLSTGAEILCLRVHAAGVRDVAYLADGQRVVSGSKSRTVCIWDAIHGGPPIELHGHKGTVLAVAASPDSQWIASGARDSTVRVWDSQQRKQLHCLRGHQGPVSTVAFSPDGRRIVSGSFDGTLRIWDAHSGGCLRTLTGHRYYVKSVVFTNDGSRIVSGSLDTTIRIWDANQGAELSCIEGPGSPILSIALSPDNRFILTGAMDCSIRMWDMTLAQRGRRLCGHENYVSSVAIVKGGRYLVSRSRESTRVWDVTTGCCVQVLDPKQPVNPALTASPGPPTAQELVASVEPSKNDPGHSRVRPGSCSPDVTPLLVPTTQKGAMTSIGPIRADCKEEVTMLVAETTNEELAIFPVELEHVVASQSGTIWAGSAADHVQILLLEGGGKPPARRLLESGTDV